MRFPVFTPGLLLAGLCVHALAQMPSCTHTVGMVVPLTGPAGRFGQAAAQAVELAFQELNKAAGPQGIAGCELVLDLRDDQGEGSVGVDQARQLVDLRKVPAIIGSIISSVTVPMVTAVTAPAGVLQISPASSTPALTKLAMQGKTNSFVLSHHHLRFFARYRRRPIRHCGRHEDPGHSLRQQRFRSESIC